MNVYVYKVKDAVNYSDLVETLLTKSAKHDRTFHEMSFSIALRAHYNNSYALYRKTRWWFQGFNTLITYISEIISTWTYSYALFKQFYKKYTYTFMSVSICTQMMCKFYIFILAVTWVNKRFMILIFHFQIIVNYIIKSSSITFQIFLHK